MLKIFANGEQLNADHQQQDIWQQVFEDNVQTVTADDVVEKGVFDIIPFVSAQQDASFTDYIWIKIRVNPGDN